ncbi:BrxA/BrxB family bacilliredoxin [Cytophaga aurantiaca]|uniref:BrxA/BrxB family bacilliredoxin n=1 Tax=Cytophaga aurantiaca TaxID=29530 RepID=UPI00036D7B05|nr:BrxA/BrxB family bacilliredoxin [Cytophaga aurantiaca]
MYPEQLVAPMKAELANAGFTELTTPEAVEAFMKKPGTSMIVINSVCGCAAGTARPGVRKSIEHSKIPANLGTVFAGVDKEAVSKAREFTLPYPPSSPAIAVFKDGNLVHFVERHHIEGRSADMIATHLKMVYDEL